MSVSREFSGVPFTRTTASVLLDATRAVAAFLVCISHWRNLLFLPFPSLPSAEKRLTAVIYVITGAGHQAVIIFFVLSGYLISASIFRMTSRGTWDWRRYMTHRLVRLWIVLLPALLLGAVIDGIGLYLHHAPLLYSGHSASPLNIDVVNRFTGARFASCLFFLNGIVIPDTFGSNGPLWSLANEFWYYVMFPLGFFALRPHSPAQSRIASAVAFLLVAFFVGLQILELFPVWLLGSALAFMQIKPFNSGLQRSIIAIYPFLFFFLAKSSWITPLVSDYMLGMATFLFVHCLLQARSAAPPSRWVDLSRLGSRFSYTLYAVHFPFLLLMTSFAVGDNRWYPTLGHFSIAVCLLFTAVAYAFVIAWLTEFRTDRVRSFVERWVLSSKSVAHSAAR